MGLPRDNNIKNKTWRNTWNTTIVQTADWIHRQSEPAKTAMPICAKHATRTIRAFAPSAATTCSHKSYTLIFKNHPSLRLNVTRFGYVLAASSFYFFMIYPQENILYGVTLG